MKLAQLETERRNENTKTIDRVPTIEKLQMINNEDMKVALAVQAVLPTLAAAIDEATIRLTKGGHVYYVGAGTSGRLGVLDASECPPTYGVDYDVGDIVTIKHDKIKAKVKIIEAIESYDKSGYRVVLTFEVMEVIEWL